MSYILYIYKTNRVVRLKHNNLLVNLMFILSLAISFCGNCTFFQLVKAAASLLD